MTVSTQWRRPERWRTETGGRTAEPRQGQRGSRRRNASPGVVPGPEGRDYRRALRVVLGLLWIVDGALQFQPVMLTKGFANGIIAPVAVGQPRLVAAPVLWASHLIGRQPVLLDIAFACAQLAIGAGLLWARTARPAIIATVLWSLGVWWMGEGLGGLATGSGTFLTGAPGAVILYTLVAVAAWPSVPAGAGWRGLLAPARPQRPPAWVASVWAVVWIGFGVLTVLPANSSAEAIAGQLGATASSSPGWLAGVVAAVESAVRHLGIWSVVGIAAVEVVVGLSVMTRGRGRRFGIWLGIGFASAVWVVGQGMGELFSGRSTDVNSAPLMVLLAVAVLGTADRAARTRAHRPVGFDIRRQTIASAA